MKKVEGALVICPQMDDNKYNTYSELENIAAYVFSEHRFDEPSDDELLFMLEKLSKYEILIYYTDSCNVYGAGQVNWMLLRNKENNKLYENLSTCCSCDGLEFLPEETSIKYLLSDHLGLFGKDENVFNEFYDGDDTSLTKNTLKKVIKDYVRDNFDN